MNRTSSQTILIVLSVSCLFLFSCMKNQKTVKPDVIEPPAPPSDLKVNLSLRPEGPVYYLSWKDNSENEKGYKISARARDESQYREIGQEKGNSTRFVYSGSLIDKTHYYRVSAYNAGGESPSRWEAIRLGYLSKMEKTNILDYELYGTVLFLLWNDGLSSIDVSDGKNPKLRNTLPLKGYVRSGNLKIDDLNAYVIDDERLFIFNIKNPYDPSFVSSLNLSVMSRDMVLSDGILYILAQNDTLYIVSARYPQKPRIIRHVKMEGTPGNMTISGNYLFIAAARDGIYVYDISNPLKPKAMDTFKPRRPRFYNAVSTYDNDLIASVRDFDNEIHIIDISDVQNMKLKTSIPLNWIPLEIASGQNTFLVPESEGGVEILWGRNPSKMKIVGSIEPSIDRAKMWATLIAMSYQNSLYLFSVP